MKKRIDIPCALLMAGVDVFRGGRLIKWLQYEAASSRTGFRNHGLLAATVLRETLGEIMLKAMPGLHDLFKP